MQVIPNFLIFTGLIRKFVRIRPALLLLTACILLAFARECRNSGPKENESTFVRYRISYLENMAGDIPTRILPKNMDCYYSPDKVVTTIEGFFGQFTLSQIADLRKKEVITLLNFFGNKVAYQGKRGELPASVLPIDNMTLTKTADTLRIAGLLSHRVEVSTPSGNYDIYYTSDIPVKKPNITTPYSQIEYPLSDFRVTLSQLKMRLTISETRTELLSAEAFGIPEGYKAVSREEMEEIINSLFTKE